MAATLFTPVKSKTQLGKYRKLSAKAGVHVSPLALGAMSIGDKWDDFLGSMNKEDSFKLLDAFWEQGGNFIDTANNYQDEQSESFIGEWAETKGIRDQLVIATKYTTNFKRGNTKYPVHANFAGNNSKSLYLSVEASLKKLRTSYIDILYLHWWDWETSIEEVMNSLHNLVVSGKVIYLGISDTPAWIVSEANRYAIDHGKTPFVIYQGEWSILKRDFEREIIPMARAHGMALAPWGAIGGGKLRSDAEEKKRMADDAEKKGRNSSPRTEDETKISQALEKVGKEHGTDNVAAVALAYVSQKVPFVFPIVGGRKVSHLNDNLKALEIALTPEQIEFLESVIPFSLGFPGTMVTNGEDELNFLMKSAGDFQTVPLQQAIRPSTK